MSRSSILNKLGGLAQVSLWAGLFLLVSIGSGAQAATVTAYRSGNTATVNGGEGAWTTAAGLIGSIESETFGTPHANPPPTASVAFGTITFGNSPGNSGNPALLGSIASNTYHDRADDASSPRPLFTFDGLGALAFGGTFDLGPNSPGTGIQLHITFTDGTTTDVVTQILNPTTGGGATTGVGFAGFFGIVSDMAIRSIRFDEAVPGQFGQAFETFDMTQVQFVSAVPIPAALPLFLSAIAALGFFGRRKIRAAAA